MSTKIPNGSSDFFEAVQRLMNAPANCTNLFNLAADCCKKCEKTIDCESCYVQTVGDLADPYRKKIENRTVTGMYSSDIYQDDDGNYHYAHPQGSG